MGEIVLDEECMGLISQFEQLTGAGSRDCIIDTRNERVILVINPGDMGRAIGKKGASIKKAAEAMGRKIEVVEYSPDPAQFLRNCFLPAQITSVEFEAEDGETIAKVGVREEDKGLAIGKEGKNIIKAKRLAQRQHNISDVRLA
jgi:N utilization substance protein A